LIEVTRVRGRSKPRIRNSVSVVRNRGAHLVLPALLRSCLVDAPRRVRTQQRRIGVLELGEEGIIAISFDDGCHLGVPEIDDLLAGQEELLADDEGGFVALLVDARPIRSMTRASMQRTVVHPVNDRTAAVAIVVDSPVSRVLGNFYIRLTKHPYPARLFKTKQDARQWLIERLEQHEP